jgi:two-component system, NtrC family, response regulator AtoC
LFPSVPFGETNGVTFEGENRGAASSRWALLIAGPVRMDTVRLPAEGQITIGRSPGSDIVLEDPSVADEHAVLRVEPPFVLVDGGSGRTAVANRRLAPGEHAVVTPGVVFSIGAVTCVVQRTMQSARLRPIRSHAYFEARVEDECVRVGPFGGTFAIARFFVRGGTNARIEAAFATALRMSDVAATYTPNEYEALLLDVSPAEASTLVEKVAEEMRRAGAAVDVAVAAFPNDARTPEALFSVVTFALHARAKADSIIPEEGAMDRMRPLVERVAQSTISVLILGETGVGKDVLANAIHAASPRAKRKMLSINCAALSETLLDSELFGYERGAFTGAASPKAGLLETAEGGTVFLDEIGELPATIQAKLLRVIEQKQVTRLGALTPRPIDVRFLAATNRDLEQDVEEGAFRRDLYFRLAAFTIAIPPLRERVTEIETLATGFIAEASRAGGRVPPEISADALAMLESYAWPGNIRELRNVIDRAMLLAPGRLIEPAHLPVDKMRRAIPSLRPVTPVEPFTPSSPSSPSPPLVGARHSGLITRGSNDAIEAAEREAIIRALDACAGNQTKAAQMLGIARRTLINRIERYNLPRPKKA